VGDHVISVVAGIISMQFGGSDIVGRIGGDEFMVFMKNVEDREEASRKAQNIVDAFCKKENLSIPDCVSVSIGMAFSDESGIEYEPLFKKADEALYVSKEKGKSCYTEYSKIGQITFEDSHTILVWTKCRNLLSTIELIFRQPLQVESVSSIEELCDLYQKKKQQTIAIYVDVSETLDDGEEMWKLLSNQPWAKSMTIVAVCHEGNMSQVKNSVLAGLAADLLFAPLEQGQLKRRLREYQKHKKETEK
uniref:GGDEF domain-containing protein n=1 Tax=Roseburia sp. TaxID=2049040 RepID=UPI003FED6048